MLTARLTLAVALMVAAIAAAQAQTKKPPVAAKFNFGFAAAGSPTKAAPIGFYTRGCLAGGQYLPHTGTAWQAMRLSRNRNWGHPEMIRFLKKFATDAQKFGWPGLLIGDISQPRGGPMLSGHRSHQVGLDADIWYMPMPKRTLTWREREDTSAIPLAGARSVKVTKNWRPGYVNLLRLAAQNPKVQRILTHPAVKKKLCESEKGDKKWLRKIRPVFGHNYHFHVRLFCPKSTKGCRAQKTVAAGDGCGKQLDYWIKLFTTPPKRSAKPRKPRKPPPVRTIDWLPKACRPVLTVDRPQLVAYSVAPTSVNHVPRRNPRRR
ncbi:MAG: penicillin-insensitive murein endopeptidase [Hyphomicrobiaceae bacterium]